MDRFCVFLETIDFSVASLNSLISAGVSSKSTFLVLPLRLGTFSAPPSSEILSSSPPSCLANSSGSISSAPIIDGFSPSSNISINSISIS